VGISGVGEIQVWGRTTYALRGSGTIVPAAHGELLGVRNRRRSRTGSAVEEPEDRAGASIHALGAAGVSHPNDEGDREPGGVCDWLSVVNEAGRATGAAILPGKATARDSAAPF
jgi:hypothetical protein